MEHEKAALERPGGRHVRFCGRWLAVLPALTAVCLIMTGCRTFNYTQEDIERERKMMAESCDKDGWHRLGGFGSMGGFNFFPNIGNIGIAKN